MLDALCVQIIFTIAPDVFRDFCKLNVNTMKALQSHSKSSLKSLIILCTIAVITVSPEIHKCAVSCFFFGAISLANVRKAQSTLVALKSRLKGIRVNRATKIVWTQTTEHYTRLLLYVKRLALVINGTHKFSCGLKKSVAGIESRFFNSVVSLAEMSVQRVSLGRRL